MGAKEDLERYWEAMSHNNTSLCLMIEKKYELDGYPPSIVATALTAKAEGRDMYKEIDKILGG